MRVTALSARQIGHEFGFQRLFDTVQRFLLYAFHPQHAHDHFHREAFGQHGKNPRRMFGLHLGQHHSHSLRIFILQVIRKNCLIHITKLVPHGPSGRTTDFFHDLRNAIPRQRAQQHAFRCFPCADKIASLANGIGKLARQILNRRSRNRAKAGHGLRNVADLVLMHHGEELGGMLLTHCQHEGRGLLRARHLAAHAGSSGGAIQRLMTLSDCSGLLSTNC